MKLTQELVDEALNNAVDGNHYKEMLSWTPARICTDLGTYDPAMEGAEVNVLLPFVTNWLERRKMTVKYEIKKATKIDAAFGPSDAYSWLPPRAEISENLNKRLKYDPLISSWFGCGLQKLDGQPKAGVDGKDAFAHVATILRSFQPKHEYKTTGCAMLLEDWFESITWADRDGKEHTL